MLVMHIRLNGLETMLIRQLGEILPYFLFYVSAQEALIYFGVPRLSAF